MNKFQPIDRIKDLLVDLGYQEAITYSFTDEKILKILTPDEEGVPFAESNIVRSICNAKPHCGQDY